MEYALEMIADICIDIAMAILLCRQIGKSKKQMPCLRLISFMFSVGFIAGVVSAGLRGTVVPLILDAVGFMLSCTIFLFSFPENNSEVDDK